MEEQAHITGYTGCAEHGYLDPSHPSRTPHYCGLNFMVFIKRPL